MTFPFETTVRPASDQAIAAVEALLGVTVSSTIRAFYATRDGGKIEPVSWKGEGHIGPRGIFAIGPDPEAYEIVQTRRLIDDERLAADLVPIAEDSFGNLICVSTTRDPGAIYWWDHELDEPSGQRLADDITEFLDDLDPFEDDVPDAGVGRAVWLDPKFMEEQRRLGNIRERPSEDRLSSDEAYAAMIAFLEAHFERTADQEIAALLGGLVLNEDGEPMDPAARSDWSAAVARVIDARS